MKRAAKSPASGRFVLRLEPELHAALQAAAKLADLSLNEYCARKLCAPLGAVQLGPAALLVQRAAERHGAELVGVVAFGSWARGEAGPQSDVDVLIVLDAERPLTRALYRAWDEEELAWENHAVQTHLVHLPEAGAAGTIWAEAAIDGIVLFERDLSISRRLAGVRRDIAEGRLVRSTVHGQPYWSDCVRRAKVRLRALDVLYDAGSWADVVRESQELVELALKGLLRKYGVEPPRIHDVSALLLAERARLPELLQPSLERLGAISRSLRRDRELAFYGAEDLTPSSFYSRDDATRAREDATLTVEAVEPHVLAAT